MTPVLTTSDGSHFPSNVVSQLVMDRFRMTDAPQSSRWVMVAVVSVGRVDCAVKFTLWRKIFTKFFSMKGEIGYTNYDPYNSVTYGCFADHVYADTCVAAALGRPQSGWTVNESVNQYQLASLSPIVTY